MYVNRNSNTSLTGDKEKEDKYDLSKKRAKIGAKKIEMFCHFHRGSVDNHTKICDYILNGNLSFCNKKNDTIDYKRQRALS